MHQCNTFNLSRTEGFLRKISLLPIHPQKLKFQHSAYKTGRFKNNKLTVFVKILPDQIHGDIRREIHREEVAGSLG